MAQNSSLGIFQDGTSNAMTALPVSGPCVLYISSQVVLERFDVLKLVQVLKGKGPKF